MIIRKVVLFILVIILGSCNNDDDSNRNLVDLLGIVNISIDLNDSKYQELRQINGYKYIEGGRRGIIVINKGSNNYNAFERNCTFQPVNDCATVSMHPSIQFMVDSCCSSRFDLNGAVIEAPATQPLISYNAFLIGNELRIQYP
jgi:hypothetical protein